MCVCVVIVVSFVPNGETFGSVQHFFFFFAKIHFTSCERRSALKIAAALNSQISIFEGIQIMIEPIRKWRFAHFDPQDPPALPPSQPAK
jgi:hypothetical protein